MCVVFVFVFLGEGIVSFNYLEINPCTVYFYIFAVDYFFSVNQSCYLEVLVFSFMNELFSFKNISLLCEVLCPGNCHRSYFS